MCKFEKTGNTGKFFHSFHSTLPITPLKQISNQLTSRIRPIPITVIGLKVESFMNMSRVYHFEREFYIYSSVNFTN